ncbi:MAG TPA: hypothetical protein VF618_23125 [Thermoanaerobaculia bacterium]
MSLPPAPLTTVRPANVAAVEGEVPPTLTITHYETLANDFLAQLDLLAGVVPQVEPEHTSQRVFVRTHVNAPLEFLSSAVASVKLMPELKVLNKLDVLAARDALQFLDAFRPVLDKVNAFARALKYTMAAKRAAVTNDAQQIYRIAQAIASNGGNPALEEHVANMKRDRFRRRKSSEEEVELIEKKAA